MKIRVLAFVLLFCIIAVNSVLGAPTSGSQRETLEKAFQEADKVKQTGPMDISLIDQAKLKLPPNYYYIPKQQAAALLEAMGNRADSNLIGLILPEQKGEDLMIVIRYDKAGYIKDEEAKVWNVDELFTSIKEGTEEANKQRKERGFPELEILGWVEKPKYDASRHQLIWSISVRDKGDTSSDPAQQGINYKTYALGREGYLTINLVTNLADIEGKKPVAAQLLAGTEFVPGKRYEDFNASTDKVAEYGLAALVAGVAAKKVGFFGLVALFVAKFAKVIGVAVLALGGILAKMFGKKKDGAPPAGPTEG